MRNLQRLETVEDGYVCGRCNFPQDKVVGEPEVVPCLDCGWIHKSRKPSDVPSEIRLDLTQYGG